MKTFLLLAILTLSIRVNAQLEQPTPKDLSAYAPLNPQQGNTYLPVQLSNKTVASILVMNSAGVATQKTMYNPEGWPVTIENSSQVLNYTYSPDKRSIKINELYFYDLDTKGNVTQYLEKNTNRDTQLKVVNRYDEKGNLIQTERFQPTQIRKGQFPLTSKGLVNYKYDEKNRKIAETGDAYEYNYEYKISNNQLDVNVFKSKEKIFEYTYNKQGILTQYKILIYGTTINQYEKIYNNKGLLMEEKTTSTKPGDNKSNGYVITYRDGTVESPDNKKLQFINAKKNHNVYTKATTNFSIQEGFFEKGKLNGPGVMTENGIQYKGNFENGKLSGYGQTILSLGEQLITIGIFEKGVLNGHGFVVRANEIVEAGIYKDGKLIQNMSEDYLSRKSSLNCRGNCTNGFGKKNENGTTTFSIFENGNAIGPYYLMKENKIMQYGAKTPDFHFLEGVVDGSYHFGLLTNKKGSAKMLTRTTQGIEAGIIKDGVFKKTYEYIIQ